MDVGFQNHRLDWVWSAFIVSIVGISIWTENPIFLAIPIGLLTVGAVVYNYSWLYFAFFLIIPFSVEFYLPNGLGTDLPSEPLMLALTGLTLLLGLHNVNNFKGLQRFWGPVTIILLLHLGWLLFATIMAVDVTRSVKFFIAKLWYVLPFYFLSIHIFQRKEHILLISRLLVWSLTVAIIYVLINHAQSDFSFETSNEVVQPIFRNHVSYAAIVVLVLPMLIWIRSLSSHKNLYSLIILLYLVAIYFSYTRAAMVCVIIGAGAYLIIKYSLVIHTLLLVGVVSLVSIIYFSIDNNYLQLAPDFEKTITHTKFNNLIEATYKMEDISTMERLYRWVAGFEMIADKPFTGFGPNNFYNNYGNYTITSFQTYVSDNPDKSGVHNYYLMTTVDQGITGLIILVLLIGMVLILGESAYHKHKTDSFARGAIMTYLVVFIIILALNLINDLVEVDKVGPFFFVSMAVVHTYFHSYTRLKSNAIK